MNLNYQWPSEEPVIIKNAFQSGVNLLKEKFGALSQDPKSLYSRICIGNSIISIEPYRGCPIACGYCMANNDLRSLNVNEEVAVNKYIKKKELNKLILRKPEKIFSTSMLIDALVKHPAFIPNKTVLGFCTGSTEFFLPELKDDLWEGIKKLANYGYKNPIWIVVKSYLAKGFEKEWLQRFEYLSKNGIKVILSISDIGATKEIEPYQVNRFEVFKFLKGSDVVITHHLRPMIPNTPNLEDVIERILTNSTQIVQSVCVGGLRIDPGMLIFWETGLTKDKDIEYIPGNQFKYFDDRAIKLVKEQLKKLNADIPVFEKTSEMISYHLGIDDYNLYRYRDNLNGAFLNIEDDKIKKIEEKYKSNIENILNNISKSIKLGNVKFTRKKNLIYINENLKYQEHRALIHAIGHSEVLK